MITELLVLVGLISICIQTLFFLKCLNSRRRGVNRLSKTLRDAESGKDLKVESKNEAKHRPTWTENDNKCPKMEEKYLEIRRKSKNKHFCSNIILPSQQDHLCKESMEFQSKEFRENPLKKNQEPFKEDEEEQPSRDINFSSLASKFARSSIKSGRNFSTAAYAKTHNQCAKLKVALIHLVKSDTKCFDIKNKLNKSNDDVFDLNGKMFAATSCLKHRSYSEGDIMTHQSPKEASDIHSSSSYSSDDSFDQIEDFEFQPGSEYRQHSSFHSLNDFQGKLKVCRSAQRNKGSYSFVNDEEDNNLQTSMGRLLSLGHRSHNNECQHQNIENRYENIGTAKYENRMLEGAKSSERQEIKEFETDPDTSCDEFVSSGPVSLIRTISRILSSPIQSVTSEAQSENEEKNDILGVDVLGYAPKETYYPSIESNPVSEQKSLVRIVNECEKNEPRRVSKRIGSVELLPFQKQLELILLHHAAKLQNTSIGIPNLEKKKSHTELKYKNLTLPHISVVSESKLCYESKSRNQSIVSEAIDSTTNSLPDQSIYHNHQSSCRQSLPSLCFENKSLSSHQIVAQPHNRGTTKGPFGSPSIQRTSKISSSCRSVSMLELNINHAMSSDRQVSSLSRLKIDSHSTADWSSKQNHSRGQKRNHFQIHSGNGRQPDSMERKSSPELMESDCYCDRSNELESLSINFSDKSINNYVATTLSAKSINRDQVDHSITEIINNNNKVEDHVSPSIKNDNFKKRSDVINDPNNNSDINVIKRYEGTDCVDYKENFPNSDGGYLGSNQDTHSSGSSSGDESVSELSSISSTSNGHYDCSKKHCTDNEHYEKISNGSTKSRNSEREKQVIQGLDDLIAGVPAPDYETTDDADSMKDALGRIDDLSNGIFRPPPPLPARVAPRLKEYDDNLSTNSNRHLSTPPAIPKGDQSKFPDSSHKASPPPIPSSAHKPQAPCSSESSHNSLIRTTSVDVSSSPPKLPHKNVSRTSSEPQKLSSRPPPPPPLPPMLSASFTEGSVANDKNFFENGDSSEEDSVTHSASSTRTVNAKTQPFVLPKFIAHPAGHGLIKPSEYLKCISEPSENNPTLPSIPESSKEDEMRNIPPVPPMPPPPPPPAPNSANSSVSSGKSSTLKSKASLASAMRGAPMPSISVTDLQSVQLRKIDNKLTKTTSVPLKITTEKDFLAQRNDVIAELKIGVDIDGIKKLKHEKVKEISESVQKEREEIKKQFVVTNFVEQVPDVDGNGNPIPLWKRQMMAKKAAEKAKKEAEEQKIREIEEQRMQNIPPWKRQLIAKKEEERQRSRVAVHGTGSTLRTLQPIATVKL